MSNPGLEFSPNPHLSCPCSVETHASIIRENFATHTKNTNFNGYNIFVDSDRKSKGICEQKLGFCEKWPSYFVLIIKNNGGKFPCLFGFKSYVLLRV